MYFHDLHSALHMDGHGAFVWAAYAITCVVLLLIVVAPLRRRRRLLREMSAEARRQRGVPTQGSEA
ncbi:heme exporter protein CcmD [Mangrovimicrobium sediminis]|uniref:Heme exporter protein D n=1 Tax=Mangrovimicrobium sediminis TaxID=2562682 RepID=A0A4Z0M7A6_9GAMM|nr:heme exporter protein CcmD [Haliea sp. SAOS-164]TGD75195.1 heme exporter protein CcmD [Haliea sp. SAOS-164]